jgi:type IV pilus assembly protein PilC
MKFYRTYYIDTLGKRSSEVIAVEHESDIFGILKERNLSLIDYKQINRLKRNSLNTVDLIIFTRQLSSMIDAGVSIVKGINIITESTTNTFAKKTYKNISQEIQRGNSLSNAMTKQGTAFPDILINMVSAGEIGGTLEKSLNLMSSHFEKEQRLINKIKSASTYPIILAVISVAVVLLLMTFVLPTITKMFDPEAVPPLTRFVMGISDFIINYWYFIIAFFVILITGTKFLLTIPTIKRSFDHMLLKLPIIGKLNRTIYSARCARSFASLYLSGIQTLEMISSTARILNNTYIESLFDEMMLKVSQGELISKAIEDMKIFDPMLSSMINVGEETGTLGDILVKTADYFDGEAENALQKMVSLIEPIMLVFMGVIIGVIIVSVIQPMFGMYDQIGG